ncbi:MAG: acyl-CoA dehydrogenase family protein [Dehalococcoidia bacterium]
MDLALNENQQMIKATARDFIEREYPWQKVRDIQESATGFSDETWRQIADLGWLGLPFPESYGGTAGDLLDAAVLLEEIGRGLLPSPYTSTVILCGLPILQFGTEAQRREFLPQIAAGQRILALALTEADPRCEASSVGLQAARDGDDYLLTGRKLFVRDANIADHLLVVARTGVGADPTNGITLFLVDAASPGIEATLLPTAAMDRQCDVAFKAVRVPQDRVLGTVGEGWPIVQWVLQRAILAECAELIGVMQKVLDTSVEYAKNRVQFGRPIGSFQGIQFKVADMVTDVDGARFITYYAIWKLLEGQPAGDDIARAKIWVSDASRRVVREGHQIHGGIGFIKEHFLHLYFRRAKTGELMYGAADAHRHALAASLLD